MDARVLEILDYVNDLCFIIDNIGDCIYKNHQANEMIKKDEKLEEILLKELMDISMYQEYSLSRNNIQVSKFEYYVSNMKKWYEISVFPDLNDTIIYMKDINTQKMDKYKIQLDNDMERLKVIFDHSALAIGIVDLTGTPVDCNQALLNMLGYSIEELSNMKFHDITHPDDLDKDVDLFNKLLLKQIDNYIVEKRYICKDNSMFWARLTVSLISDHQGNPRYVMSTMENIHELKKLEEQKAYHLKELQ